MTISIFHPASIFPMGEDSVALIRRIQDDFCIEFAETELAGIATVGDLYEVLLGKVETGDSCRSSQAFYRLRKAMMAVLNKPRKAIRPGTQLGALLPDPKRKVLWKQLEETTYLSFPKLRHPRWARDVIRSLALASAIAFQIGMNRWTHPRGFWWVDLEIGVVAVFVIVRQSLFAATGFLGIGLPVRTVGELVKAILSTNFSQFTPEAGNALPYSPAEVWEQLGHILSEELGLEPEKIAKETRFEGHLDTA